MNTELRSGRKDTWQSLMERQRSFQRASVRAGNLRVDLVLMAVPIGVEVEEISPVLQQAVGV